MASLLFEQPWLIGSIGTALTAMTFYGWIQSGSPFALKAACGLLVGTILLVILNLCVVTYGEEVRRWIHDAAKELELNQRDKVLARIHPDCTSMVDSCLLRMDNVRFTTFRVTKIHGVDAVREHGVIKATAKMNVFAEAEVEEYYRELKGRISRWVQLKLEREQGYWRVLDIEEREAQHEFMRSSD